MNVSTTEEEISVSVHESSCRSFFNLKYDRFFFLFDAFRVTFFSLSACLSVVSPWLSLFRCHVMNGALTAILSAERRVSSAKDIRETRAERAMVNKESLTW